MKNERDLMVRLGLIFIGVFLIFTGFTNWDRGQIHIHHEIAVLCFITYLLGFFLIFLSAINYKKLIKLRYIEYLILILLIFGIIFWAYTYTRVFSPHYGTDAIAFNHYAARLVLDGKNPYVYPMEPALDEFGVLKEFTTTNIDGTVINRVSYPALSFLVYVPFVGAGLSDMRVVTLLFQMLTICVIFFKAPKNLKPLILLPLVFPDMLDHTVGGCTDFLWVFPLVLMVIYIERIHISGVLYGVACAIKPIPLILAPFLLIWYWKTNITSDLKQRLFKVAKFLSIALIIFLIPNLFFILDNPNAWRLGAFAPAFGKMIPFGSGISSVSQIGVVGLTKTFYTVSVILVTLTLMINYFVYFDRIKHAIWIFPAIILLFFHRSLHSYFIYWIPLVLISLCIWYTKVGKDRFKEKTLRAKKIWKSRYEGFIAPVSLALCALLILVSGFVFQSQEKLSVEVTGEVKDTEAIGRVSELMVNVVNDGPTTVEPKFSIIGCGGGTFTFYWEIENGPKYLDSKSSATYLIHAETWRKAITDGRIFIVRVNDASSNVFFVSKPVEVKLENSASNPA